METTKINTAIIEVDTTLDDFIFTNRNHEYGAFELRKGYEKTMRKSFLIGSAIFVLALFISNIYANRDQTAEKPWTTMNPGDYHFPPPVEPPIVIPPPPVAEVPDVPTTEFLPPEITLDPIEDDTPPTQVTLSIAPPAEVTNVGIPDDIGLPIEEDAKPEEIVVIKPVEDKEFIVVEQLAEYPGGMKAMIEFLSNNLKYPAAAVRSNISGKVFLSFGVDKNGNIYDVTVTKGIGFNCDEEAVRVVKAMPKWKPGRQSGNAVKSRFNLPIAFMLE
jgi:protein TonB